MSRFKIQTPSGWTIFVFGVMALLLGLLGILNPNTVLMQLGFAVVDKAQRASHDYTLVFITASSMASFNMGVYYVLAALNDVRQFYRWTVPFRALTFTVFTVSVLSGLAPARFLAVAIWELVGGIATGMALYYEKRNRSVG
ncbi:MAG: hypothetical protein V9G20_21650 [Candidatus Promineifilaceae bacterium]